MAQAKSVKKSHSEEKRSPTLEKAVILSSKWNKTTMKNSWVDKDLRKSTKKKCFEENGAVQEAKKNRTTKNWVKEELGKFPIKKEKENKNIQTLKRQSKCHVFVKQVCFSYSESPRTPPLVGTSLHRRNISVERPWGILSLFTTCLPLWVKSSRRSRCHVSPTQELMTCILRRQSRITGKDGTRKKSAAEEDPRTSPEKNLKNEPPEQLKSTQSLKRERPQNKTRKKN